jgi:hypothetical protein
MLHLYVSQLAHDNSMEMPTLVVASQQTDDGNPEPLEEEEQTVSKEGEASDSDEGESDEVEDEDGLASDDKYGAAPVPAPVAEKDDKAKARKGNVMQFMNVSLALTNDINLPTMLKRHNDFFQADRRVKGIVAPDNSRVIQHFTRLQAIHITNIFFDKMMGPTVLSYLANLISQYSKHHNNEMTIELLMRAYT